LFTSQYKLWTSVIQLIKIMNRVIITTQCRHFCIKHVNAQRSICCLMWH